MRYIINENNPIIRDLSDETYKRLLEDLGYTQPEEGEPDEVIAESKEETVEETEETLEENSDVTEYTTLYEANEEVHAVLEDVYEIEGELYVEAYVLEDQVQDLKESNADEFSTEVSFNDTKYLLEDVFDLEGSDCVYIRLKEAINPKASGTGEDDADPAMANDGTTAKKSSRQVKKLVKKSGGALAGGEGPSNYKTPKGRRK